MNMGNRVIRLISAVGAGVATSIALGVAPAAVATPDDGQQQASCVYTLSKPFVAEVSGVKMASATLDGLPCTGNAQPNAKTVCIQLGGADDPPQCRSKGGYDTVQVFAPYRPGTTYVSTGTGCGPVAPSLTSVCSTQGPLSATL